MDELESDKIPLQIWAQTVKNWWNGIDFSDQVIFFKNEYIEDFV